MKAAKEFFVQLSSPILNSPVSPIQCTNASCILCDKGAPLLLHSSSSWADIALVVLYCLHQEHSTEYLSLKNYIYPFVSTHLDALYGSHSPNSAAPGKWRKLLLDSLLQDKDTFGVNLQDKGEWKLIKQIDPWTKELMESRKQPLASPSKSQSPSSLSIKERRKRALPYLPKRTKLLDEIETTSLEDEFTSLQQELDGKLESMKSEISSLRAEVNQRHENNLQKIHYLEDLLGTYVPGIKYVYISSRQSLPEDKEEAAKTVLAIEGLEEIHNQWRENKEICDIIFRLLRYEEFFDKVLYAASFN